MSIYPEPGQLPPAPPPAPARLSIPATIPYVTYTIVGATTLVYLLQLASGRVFGYYDAANGIDWLEYFAGLIPGAIRAGELWRFITPVLLHASVPHIAFNMYAVWLFGIGLERHFGHWRYLVLYLLAGFAGNVTSFLHLPSNGLSVGASTAIFGLVAAEGIFLMQNRELFGNQFGRAIGNVIFIVAINLGLDAFIPAIDIWGHLGGLAGGLLFTLVAGPVWQVQQVLDPGGMGSTLRLADVRDPRTVVTGAAAVVLIFGIIAAIGVIHPFVP